MFHLHMSAFLQAPPLSAFFLRAQPWRMDALVSVAHAQCAQPLRAFGLDFAIMPASLVCNFCAILARASLPPIVPLPLACLTRFVFEIAIAPASLLCSFCVTVARASLMPIVPLPLALLYL